MSQKDFSKEDLQLISDLNAAIQEEKHRGLWFGVILMAAFLVVFITWSYFSQVAEITHAQGSVIPSSHEQIIQSLDPGILKTMNVHEGDLVKKGQILATLDDTRAVASLSETQVRVQNLEAMRARYRAEAYGVPLVFPKGLPAALIHRETEAYKARKKSLEEAIAGMKRSKAILDEQIKRTAKMVARGVSSKIELLRLEQNSSDLGLQIVERRNQYLTDANNQLVKIASDLAQEKENLALRADPVKRSVIRSPVRGIVNNIKINTIGGVVNAGAEIMEIIPIDENLLIQAYVRPQDVAFIRPGQEAVVKLSAYEYSIYGGLKGTVKLISPDTLTDDHQQLTGLGLNPREAYYRVLVETNGSTITDKNGEPMPIRPGMIATVDIKTGQKSIFQYLIKPLTRLKQALHER